MFVESRSKEVKQSLRLLTYKMANFHIMLMKQSELLYLAMKTLRTYAHSRISSRDSCEITKSQTSQ